MNILLIDDDPLSLESLNDFLGAILGHHVTRSESAKEALAIFKRTPYPMVITDLRMPEMSGVDLLRLIRKSPEGRFTDVVVITGYGDMKSAIEALRAGAFDYLHKPINVEELALVVDRINEHQTLLRENNEFTHRFDEKVAVAVKETEKKFERLKKAYAEVAGIGRVGIFSKKMRDVASMTEKLHRDPSIPVLIEGETGTGKEVVARLIHYGQGDVTTPFVSINCAAIASNLFESELFGYEGSAFTGAKKEGMQGKFEIANGGTLFLDEIGDMPIDLQPKLLRALQEREIYRVGGNKIIKLNVRIICATNRNLQLLVNDGIFRSDLFYRLNTGRLLVPPLREQKDAIAPLAQLFLERFAEEKKRRFKFLTKESGAILEEYSWPGNIRELLNAVERVVLLYDDTEIKPEYLNFLFPDGKEQYQSTDAVFDPESIRLPPDKLDLRNLEDTIIRKALELFRGNKTLASQYLGITRSTLRSKIKRK
jgi:two-component system, NtrC family, response regulator AtoC